ncbi:MAG: cation diffusion facilitator family transporter [Bacteriovorax sp.]
MKHDHGHDHKHHNHGHHDHKHHNHSHHDHDRRPHSHGHHHHHAPKNYNRAFIIGIVLNSVFVLIESLYGYLSGSLALLADAGHNLSDVAGLLIAWGAFWLSEKKPTTKFTFGLRKSSILSALFNSIFLLIAVGIIIWEALHRLWSPNPVQTKTVIIVAGVGIVINALTALLFFKDKNHDLNIRGAYLHMASDALISLGVVLAAIVISYTSKFWIDPAISIIISLIIIYGTWDLLKNSIHLSMDAVPVGINPMAVKKYFEGIQGVLEVHDLHIWAMSTSETALSVHLTMNKVPLENSQLAEISRHLNEHFKIHHPTIQVELFEEHFECHLKPEDVI